MSEDQELKLVFPEEKEKKMEVQEIQIVFPIEEEEKLEFQEIQIVYVEKKKQTEQEVILVVETEKVTENP